MKKAAISALAVITVGLAWAQLPPVPETAENPITEEKRVLGKILFWDEQLSSDDTVSCGTCHSMAVNGADSRLGNHPGFDEIFGNVDDVVGSPGVVRRTSTGEPIDDPMFGFDVQVTGRAANPVIDTAFVPRLFWDGRADDLFRDPETGHLVILSGAALETQAVAPVLSSVEMARDGRTWADVVAKLEAATPMFFGADVPQDMSDAIDADPAYPDLFEAAFGDPAITPVRIGFALATYERTLVADETPWDLFIGGDTTAMSLVAQDGWNFFETFTCANCHVPPHFTNFGFRNIGVRPVEEDIGRQAVTGSFGDRGRFKVPTLRNAALKTTFFHNGSETDIIAATRFYEPGNQNDTDNLDANLPITIPAAERQGLLAFLTVGLVDPRVANQEFPFDQPILTEGVDPRGVFQFEADRQTMNWMRPQGVIAFRMYRGDLTDFADVDDDGLPDGGYGDCVTDMDPDDTDTTYVDAEIPGSGEGFFYIRTQVTTLAGDTGLGTTSDGLLRVPANACP